MKKFSKSAAVTLIIASSFGVLSSSTAFAKSKPKLWDGHAPDISGTVDEKGDRSEDLDEVMNRINMDIYTQEHKAADAQTAIAEISAAPAPQAGKLDIGVSKAKNKFALWLEKRKMKRALEKEDSGKITHAQEEIVMDKSVAKIQKINSEDAPGPDPMKKLLFKGKSRVETIVKTRELNEAVDFRKELETQKQLIDGYRSSDPAKRCANRDCLLARYKLVSNMIKAQNMMKLDELKHLSKTPEAEKANLEKLKIEQELLVETLNLRHDLEDSKVIDPNSPVDTLSRMQKKVAMKEEHDRDMAIALNEVKNTLVSASVASELRPVSAAGSSHASSLADDSANPAPVFEEDPALNDMSNPNWKLHNE